MTKRAVDVLLGSFFLVAMLPVIAVVAAMVMVNLGRPIFFTQVRPGLHAAPFAMFKFRTMSDAKNADGELLPDAERLGSVGKFLRRYSLDELPELLNVIRGDMSLVGPRPLLVEYLPLYSDVQQRRHEVRPGLTGVAQVYGRNAISWERKFELDVWYVDNQSLWLDVKLIIMSVIRVIRPRGIAMTGHTTMPPFSGSD